MYSAKDDAPTESVAAAKPRVVYTNAPLQLARLVGRDESRWELELGGEVRTVEAAEDVDPELLVEVLERGGRVLVETCTDLLNREVFATLPLDSSDLDAGVALLRDLRRSFGDLG